MSLISQIGTSLLGNTSEISTVARSLPIMARRPGLGRSALMAGAVGVGGASGFASGVGSQDITSGTFELATGDPQIDQYALGTDVGIRTLFAPLPFERARATISMINPTTIGRHFSTNKDYYNNKMPEVNGDVVFGMYNSRMR